MELAKPSRLRYVDAGDVEDSRVDFDGLDVHDPAGTKLGEVDGFIIDRETDQPYYVVVDSGGWFISERYLVPIGHARLDSDNDRLRLDIEREAIERFPPFDATRFEQMPEDEARRFNEQLLRACCPAELTGRHVLGRWDYAAWSHYRAPDWWRSRPLGSATASSGTTERLMSQPTRQARSAPSAAADRIARQRVVAQGRDLEPGPADPDAALNTRPLDPVSDRARPGDILAIEHEGGTTSLGDSESDEVERRKEAARNVRRDHER